MKTKSKLINNDVGKLHHRAVIAPSYTGASYTEFGARIYKGGRSFLIYIPNRAVKEAKLSGADVVKVTISKEAKR